MCYCPSCCGPGIPLGSLGWTTHYKCRDCGTMFHETTKPRKKKAKKS